MFNSTSADRCARAEPLAITTEAGGQISSLPAYDLAVPAAAWRVVVAQDFDPARCRHTYLPLVRR